MNQSNTIFLFMGPPGSGKGTLAAMCIKEFGWQQLSTGNLCRSHIQKNTAIGQQIKAIIDEGSLIPDAMIAQMVKEWILSQKDTAKNIILDGYPRTKQQAALFYELLQTYLKSYKLVLVKLQADTDLLVNRIVSRLFCSNKECQQVYSLLEESHAHPKVAMTCDTCGAVLKRRSDDTKEVLKHRLELYEQHEKALLDFFVQKGFDMVVLDGMQSAELVFEEFKQLAE